VAVNRMHHRITSPVVARNGEMYSTKFDLAFDPLRNPEFLESMPLFDDLAEAGFTLTGRGGDYRLSRGERSFRLRSRGDIEIAHEIYARTVYDLSVDRPQIVIDVGANMGLSAIYLYDRFKVPVHAFELVPSTAELAEATISENGLRDTITVHPFGLGGSDAQFEIAIADSFRGGASLFDYDKRGLFEPDKKERVRVVDVASLDAIIGAPVQDGLLKLDCEGAEYAILERLVATGTIRSFRWIVMEIHRFAPEHDPDRALALLREAGFQYFHQTQEDNRFGFVFAYRG